MSENDSKMQEFLELCARSEFPNRDDVLRGLASGEYSLEDYHEGKVPAFRLLNIYKTRAGRLAQYSNEHAQKLRKDSLSLVAELKGLDHDFVNSWSVAINEFTSYFLFFAIGSDKIIGCLRVIDRRKVSEEKWNEIWGNPVAINFAN